MPDLEKVLKALECCKNKTCDNAKPDVVCPYSEWSGEYETSYCECTERLADDALTLLKTQEPIEPIIKQEMDDVCSCIDAVAYCGKCGAYIGRLKQNYCSNCGKAVKWDENP